MKTILTRLALVLTPLLALAQFAASQSAYAGGSCAACDPYFSERNTVESYCSAASGEAPSAQRGSGRDGSTPESLTKEQPLTCEQRKEKFRAEYSMMAEQCEAWAASGEGSKKEKITAVVYTASAAVCLAQCLKPALEWSRACQWGGYAAVGVDIFQALQLGSMANAASGIASGVGQIIFQQLSQEIATKSITTGAIQYTQQISNPACWIAGLNAAIAGLKFAGMTGAKKTEDEACTVVGNLRGSGTGAIAGGYYGGTTGGSARAGTNGSGTSSAPTVEDSSMNEGFMDGVRSAATGDPEGPLGKMNLDKLPEDLQKLGITPQNISDALDSQSPGSFLGGMPGMPSNIAAALKEADKQISDFANSNPQAIARSGGGGTGGAKKPGEGAADFSSLFGKKEEAGAKLGATVDFKAPGKSGDNDIWHASWKGTIFQIVSNRLDKSRDKVDQVEWQSPLNRALTGLPSKAKEK